VQAMRFFVKRVPGEDVGTAALGCPVEQGSTRVWGKACSGRIRLPHCAITSTKQINKHKPRNGKLDSQAGQPATQLRPGFYQLQVLAIDSHCHDAGDRVSSSHLPAR
jgi:hypothetical protein